jgi:(p)ppGpp synthase/HD superfamily hydrolase
MAVLEAHEAHQNLVDELIAEVAAYNPAVDRDLLARAFRFAAKAHSGQHRRSGQDFVLHPLGAARICAELHLDEQTIAAALLHDVVEDTEQSIDDIRSEFGEDVARLVEGVTKLTRIQFQTREQVPVDRRVVGGHLRDQLVDEVLMRLVRLENSHWKKCTPGFRPSDLPKKRD